MFEIISKVVIPTAGRILFSRGIGKFVDAITENCDPATRMAVGVAVRGAAAVLASGPDAGNLLDAGYDMATDTFLS